MVTEKKIMPIYNASNIEDHPVESHKDLKASLESLQQQVEQLKNHSHETSKTVVAEIPDPVKHKYISFAKSAVRIAAGLFLIWPQSVILAGIFLIVAEILGVAEEMV